MTHEMTTIDTTSARAPGPADRATDSGEDVQPAGPGPRVPGHARHTMSSQARSKRSRFSPV